MFLSSLEFPRCVMIMERMVTLVESALGVGWSTSWIQLMFLTRTAVLAFIMTAERSATSKKSVPGMGLLVV